MHDFDPSSQAVTDTNPSTSAHQPEPPGPVPAPAPHWRGAFPTRPSSSAGPAKAMRIATDDPLTRLVAATTGTDLARATSILGSVGGLTGLAHASEADLARASVPKRRVTLLRAAFELARMSIGTRPQLGQRLACGNDVWLHMRARLSGVPVEEFWLIALDVRHRVVADEICARGSLTGVEVHPPGRFPTPHQRGSRGGHLLPQPPLGRYVELDVMSTTAGSSSGRLRLMSA